MVAIGENEVFFLEEQRDRHVSVYNSLKQFFEQIDC